MFYKRKFYLILSLFLVIVMSVACASVAYFYYIKSVTAAEQTTDGVYTLSDLLGNSDSISFSSDDKYLWKSGKKYSDANYLGRIPPVSKTAVFETQLELISDGKLFFTFEPLDPSKSVITFYLDATLKNIQIDDEKSKSYAKIITDNDNVLKLTCTVTETTAKFKITNGDMSVSVSKTHALGSTFNLHICHNANFISTIYNAYYLVNTETKDANGENQIGEKIKVDRGSIMSESLITKPSGYTENGELYEFDYWSVDGERYDFNKPVHSTFTLVAQYKKASQIKGSITVVDSDGNILQSFYENEIYGIDSKFDKSKVETTIDKLKGFTYDGSLYCKLSDIPFENNDIQVTAEVITVYMEDGASVRLAEPAGIRFSGGNSIDCVEYGMFLTAKDYLSDNENNMTVDYLKENNLTYSIITSLNDIQQSVNGGIAKYAIVLKDIKTENYGVDFVARSFVKVKYYDNTECYIYSDFSFDDNSRSIYNVANKAISDFGGSNEVLQKYIDGVIELKEIDGEIIFIANNYKNYKVELQKEENSVLITVIPNDGIESLVIGSIIFNGKLKKIDVSSSNQYRISYR